MFLKMRVPIFRQDNRRPIASNEYDGPRTQASVDRNHESHEQEEEESRHEQEEKENQQTTVSHSRQTTVSHSRDSNPRREHLSQVEQQNEYESPQVAASQDKEGLLIESVPSGYERQVHGDFSIDNR